MKKLLAIMVLGLLWSVSANAFFSTQLFQKDKELNLNNFFNFDITKYKFEDHEEIIGKDFTKWDGDPGKKGKDEIDFKMISVLVDGNKQKLKLRKFKDKMWLSLTLDGYSCAQAKEKVPSRFINKKHYKEYVSDFYFMKMHQIQFSYDTKNSRVSFFCMETESSQPDTNPTTLLRVASKKDKKTPQILPMKMISCQLKEAKTNMKNEWSQMKSGSYLTFHIMDDEKKLYDQRKISAGKIQTFNKDKIHTINQYKYDKSKKITFYNEYSIDRVNGSFTYRKKTYDPDPRFKNYHGVKNGIIIVDYVGSCEKKSEDRKF
jgi:hypothetical protein|tara:strand:- start:83 stop:1033 length:951 start_codon:yes stop_codon:yes gene_type:complete